MSRTLASLLASIPDEQGRTEVLELGRRVLEASRSGRAAEQQKLVEAMSERIQWYFRAARYPLPRADELQRMVEEHFR